jgi:hypothetical protein
VAALVTALLTVLLAAAPAHPAGPAPRAGTPTLATEDTLRTEVPAVLVRAPRVTLDEILARVERGERRRDSLMTDQRFLVTARLVRGGDAKRAPQVLSEWVARVYRKRPDRVRTQVLRDYQAKRPEKGKPEVKVQVGADGGMDEEIVNFAFRPGRRREFRYRVLGRDLVGGHVIYRVGFEPRSLLDPAAPHGMVWIDTNDFVIVRQEVGFDHSPAPPLLKDVKRIVIERARVDGHWVLSRLLMRAEMSVPLPQVGRAFDFSMRFDDYAINTGLPDSLFAPPGREKP